MPKVAGVAKRETMTGRPDEVATAKITSTTEMAAASSPSAGDCSCGQEC
jgi:hypothetical protein